MCLIDHLCAQDDCPSLPTTLASQSSRTSRIVSTLAHSACVHSNSVTIVPAPRWRHRRSCDHRPGGKVEESSWCNMFGVEHVLATVEIHTKDAQKVPRSLKIRSIPIAWFRLFPNTIHRRWIKRSLPLRKKEVTCVFSLTFWEHDVTDVSQNEF